MLSTSPNVIRVEKKRPPNERNSIGRLGRREGGNPESASEQTFISEIGHLGLPGAIDAAMEQVQQMGINGMVDALGKHLSDDPVR
jgi:hypothetical protein